MTDRSVTAAGALAAAGRTRLQSEDGTVTQRTAPKRRAASGDERAASGETPFDIYEHSLKTTTYTCSRLACLLSCCLSLSLHRPCSQLSMPRCAACRKRGSSPLCSGLAHPPAAPFSFSHLAVLRPWIELRRCAILPSISLFICSCIAFIWSNSPRRSEFWIRFM